MAGNSSTVRSTNATLQENDKMVQDWVHSSSSDFINSLREKFQKKLDEHKNTPVKIAVTGQSGAGKSTLINKLRGLLNEKGMPKRGMKDKLAKSGPTQTTMDIKGYPFPENELIMLYDLPGVGTKEWPIETYHKDAKFEDYDAFIILTSDRFYENDLRIAMEVKKLGKPYFFARTKIDQALKSYNRDSDTMFSKEGWTNKCDDIRNECREGLKGVHNKKYHFQREECHDADLQKIYLISCRDYSKVDADDESQNLRINFRDNQILKEDLVDSLEGIKRTALLFHLECDRYLISKKVEELKKRIPIVTALSALGGAIPLPGASMAIDTGLYVNESIFQQSQLKVDSQSMDEWASLVGMNRKDFIDCLQEKRPNITFLKHFLDFFKMDFFKIDACMTADAIKALIGSISVGSVSIASEVTEDVLKLAIPIFGSVLASAISGTTTYWLLEKTLDTNSKLAMDCLELVEEKLDLETFI